MPRGHTLDRKHMESARVDRFSRSFLSGCMSCHSGTGSTFCCQLCLAPFDSRAWNDKTPLRFLKYLPSVFELLIELALAQGLREFSGSYLARVLCQQKEQNSWLLSSSCHLSDLAPSFEFSWKTGQCWCRALNWICSSPCLIRIDLNQFVCSSLFSPISRKLAFAFVMNFDWLCPHYSLWLVSLWNINNNKL